ncbi:hypothetical protein D1007_61800 [Hordeum vulgare]|nr:hypothetical protein D1007_61800 [Hordeum vulgare]
MDLTGTDNRCDRDERKNRSQENVPAAAAGPVAGSTSPVAGAAAGPVVLTVAPLDLHEEEFDDVIVEEEAPELADEIPWLALARVQTNKNFSQAAFFKDTRAAWNTVKPVRCRPIGANLFVIQAHCLGDWDRIMSPGPWLFRNMAMIFAPYDGYSEATDVPMVHMPIWLQIHKLPNGYCRADVVEKLLRSSREILETRIARNSRGDYIRVRVKHDVTRPLTKFVSIVKGKVRTVYAVRYEKLARFCKACVIIGHDHKECGNGVHEERDLKFGDYLYADPRGSSRQNGSQPVPTNLHRIPLLPKCR